MDLSQSWHPQGRFHELPALGRLHVVSLGQQHAARGHVLLLHGFVQASWAWRFNVEALAEHFAVHAICLPGFGWSCKPRATSYRLVAQAERIVQLCDLLGIACAHVVGNSLGGSLALQLALLQPQRFERLVLVNPAGSDLGVFNALLAVQIAAWEPLLHLPGIKSLLGLGLRHVAYAGVTVDQQFVQSFFAPMDAAGAKYAALQVAGHFGRDLAALEARLGDITHQTLVCWGQSDGIVPRSTVERTVRGLRQARLEVFDCSGHCPMEEEPRRFNREVVQFLRARK